MKRTYKPFEGSRITVHESTHETEILWQNQGSTLLSRMASSLFRIVWLIIWTIGGGAIFTALAIHFDETSLYVKIFLSILFIFWVIGEYSGIRSIIDGLMKSEPERLVLESEYVTHDPGTFLDGMDIPQAVEDPDKVSSQYELRKISKGSVGGIRMEKIGEVAVLSIGFGKEKIKVGIFLEEEDLEWLYKIIMNWKDG